MEEIKIAIIGSSGLLGKALKEHLTEYKIVPIPGKKVINDPLSVAKDLTDVHTIINVAGHPVFGRWTPKRRRLVYESRVGLSMKLCDAIALMDKKPVHLINASAIGIYRDGFSSDEFSGNYANNQLAGLVQDWEKAINKVKKFDVALTIIRIGMVLSVRGGSYKLLRRIIKLGLGAILGSGRQGVSFILIEDLINAVHYIMHHRIYGIVNLVSPQPLDNNAFITSISRRLKRPVLFKIPGFILKIIFKEGSLLLLDGQFAYPKVLTEKKFTFMGNNLEECLDILEK